MAKRRRSPRPAIIVNPSYGFESGAISHEVGSFPRFIGDAPPQPYRYDPRQGHNPEDFPPAPPGYGEKGGEYTTLEDFKQEGNEEYLPQNADGSTSYPPEIGPEPPTFHATNIPETARKWGKQGQDYTFLAESPGAMKTAKEIGAPKIMRGYTDEERPAPIGPRPGEGELDEMRKFNDFWDHHAKENYPSGDPLKITPAEEGMKAEEVARNKYALELMNREPGSADYKGYEKLISEAKKDAIQKAEWQSRIAQEDKKQARVFFMDRMKEERKAAGKDETKPQTRANVEAAQKYTENMLYGPNSWENYQLTDDDVKKMKKDKNWQPENRKIKDRILTDVNRVRELSGLPPITEKAVKVPMKEYRDWGLFRTGEKDAAPGRGYRYEEGQKPAARAQQAGAAKIVKSGRHKENGRMVNMYSDGRVEYAPN